jgi:hypothetical protein
MKLPDYSSNVPVYYCTNNGLSKRKKFQDRQKIPLRLAGAGFLSNTNSKSRRYLRWLVFGSSTYVLVRLRRLNPRRLDFILDLNLE